MVFNDFSEDVRASDWPERSGIDKAQCNRSVRTHFPFLIENRLPDDQFRKRDTVDFSDGRKDIPHPRRMPEPAFHGYDGNHDAILPFTPFDRESPLYHHPVPRNFKIPDIIGVMDNRHLVRFIVPDRERDLKMRHNKKVTT